MKRSSLIALLLLGGTLNAQAYKGCMRRRGWRYGHTVRERAT
jgi:hypothetical protein